MEGTRFAGHGEDDLMGIKLPVPVPKGNCTEDKSSSGAQRKESGNRNMMHQEKF